MPKQPKRRQFRRRGPRPYPLSSRQVGSFDPPSSRQSALEGAVPSFIPGTVVRSLNLFPQRYRTRLRYSEIGEFPVGATVNGYVWAANGLYDPNISGTGHQPMGFDQIMLFFRHYCVINSQITVNAWRADATPNGVILTVAGKNETPFIDPLRQIEMGNCSYAILNGGMGQGGTGSNWKITKSLNTGMMKGNDDVLDNSNMKGDASNNPAELIYWVVTATAPDASGPLALPVDILVQIDFDVVFTEPLPPTQS